MRGTRDEKGCKIRGRKSEEKDKMKSELSIGFIGFGEAGFEIAKGLREEGITRMFLCHLRKSPSRNLKLR